MTAKPKAKPTDAPVYGKPDGASAQSIWAHLFGGEPQYGSYPLDGGDFGRCEDFLDQFPSVRTSLHLMADVNDYWKALVARWEDIRSTPVSQRTALIKTIIRPIQRGDPGHITLGDSVAAISFGANTFKAGDQKPPPEFIKAADDMARKDRLPMKDDPDFRKHNQDAYAVTADELRQFIERFEQLEAEKKDVTTQQKELMGEAKGRGYDTKVMRKVIALRKRKPDELAEEEAVLDLYKTALGMA